MNLRLNGTEYESDEVIEDEVLSASNLEDVTIDDVHEGKMVLNSKYPFGTGTRFSLRHQTDVEKLMDEVSKVSNEAKAATNTANEAKEMAQTGSEYAEAGKILLGEEV